MLKNQNPGQPFPLNKERQIASYLKKIARKGKYYSGAKAAKDLGIAPSTVLQKAAKLNLDIEAVISPEYRIAIDKLKKFPRIKKGGT